MITCLGLKSFSFGLLSTFFGTKLYRQIVGISMGTNCAPLLADMFNVALKKILWPRFLVIKKVKLFKHLTLHLDIWTFLNY